MFKSEDLYRWFHIKMKMSFETTEANKFLPVTLAAFKLVTFNELMTWFVCTTSVCTKQAEKAKGEHISG